MQNEQLSRVWPTVATSVFELFDMMSVGLTSRMMLRQRERRKQYSIGT